MKNIFAKLALTGFTASFLAGCVPQETVSYSENVHTDRCESGGAVFNIEFSVPEEYGRINVLTQHAQTSQGLVPVCRLNTGSRDRNFFYYGYLAEVYEGNAGLCVSARTENAGHVMACASQSRVRQAVNAPAGTPNYTINLSNWTAYRG